MRVAGILFLFLAGCVGVSAQYTVVTEAEYRTTCGNGAPVPYQRRAQAFREIHTTTTVDEAGVSTVSFRTFVNRNGKNYHQITEHFSNSGRKVTERLFYDGKHYERDAAGLWKDQSAKYDRWGDPQQKFERQYFKIEYRMYPAEMIDAREVRVCEVFQSTATIETASGKEVSKNEYTTRSWNTKDGSIKRESRNVHTSNGRSRTVVLTSEYEIDDSIKIEPPVVVSQ